MGEMGRKGWLDDLYGKLLRLHLHYIWPRRKPYGLIARARGKSLPGPAHGLEPAAQQLRPLRPRQLTEQMTKWQGQLKGMANAPQNALQLLR